MSDYVNEITPSGCDTCIWPGVNVLFSHGWDLGSQQATGIRPSSKEAVMAKNKGKKKDKKSKKKDKKKGKKKKKK
jgi:hypothetical protein